MEPCQGSAARSDLFEWLVHEKLVERLTRSRFGVEKRASANISLYTSSVLALIGMPELAMEKDEEAYRKAQEGLLFRVTGLYTALDGLIQLAPYTPPTAGLPAQPSKTEKR